MSYISDNVGLIRANTNSTAWDAGEVTDNISLPYSNLFYPYILDNGGNTEIVSLTIDIFNPEELKEDTENVINKDWAKDQRLRDNLSTAKAIWGFKQAYHGFKKSRSISNGFCFGGQAVTFYIAPQGHGTGNIENKWLYCKTSITIKAIDVLMGTETTLHTFDNFESSKTSSDRYFTWIVPTEDQTAFDNYGLFGMVVLRVDVTETYYEDAEWTVLYTDNVPNVNQAHLQLLIYTKTLRIVFMTKSIQDFY